MSLPRQVMVSDADSFAAHTLKTRLPAIAIGAAARRPPKDPTAEALSTLAKALDGGRVEPLPATGLPEVDAAWIEDLTPWFGHRWTKLPFFLAEAYFYARLLWAAGYFHSSSPWRGVDPFAAPKAAELATLTADPRVSDFFRAEVPVETLVRFALLGNRADLSNTGIAEGAHAGLFDSRRDDIIVDETAAVTEAVSKASVVGFLLDNAGAELAADLALASRCVADGKRVVFYAKKWPTFVSDATAEDVGVTISACRRAGFHLAEGVRPDSESFRVVDHWFFNSARHFSQLPVDLVEEIGRCDFVLVKGDANYRRLVEDRHWAPEAGLDEAAADLPRGYAVLRTLKSEVVLDVGMDEAKRLDAADPRWKVNGRYGIVRLVEKKRVGPARKPGPRRSG